MFTCPHATPRTKYSVDRPIPSTNDACINNPVPETPWDKKTGKCAKKRISVCPPCAILKTTKGEAMIIPTSKEKIVNPSMKPEIFSADSHAPPSPSEDSHGLPDTPGEKPVDRRIIDCYEHLSIERLDTLGNIYAPRIRFKDPFVEIGDLHGLKRYFSNMLLRGRHPKFQITKSVGDGRRLSLYWIFRYERFGINWKIHGSFLLELNPQGLIVDHEDFWDVSSQIYEKLPVAGCVFRFIKRGLISLM